MKFFKLTTLLMAFGLCFMLFQGCPGPANCDPTPTPFTLHWKDFDKCEGNSTITSEFGNEHVYLRIPDGVTWNQIVLTLTPHNPSNPQPGIVSNPIPLPFMPSTPHFIDLSQIPAFAGLITVPQSNGGPLSTPVRKRYGLSLLPYQGQACQNNVVTGSFEVLSFLPRGECLADHHYQYE